MNKRLLLLFLGLTAAISFCFAGCGNKNDQTLLTVTQNGMVFTLDKNGDYMLTDCNDNQLAKEVVVPSKVNGIKVKTIAPYAFYSNQNIVSVEIEEGVEIISEQAFYNCMRLSKITLPSTVNSIEWHAFGECLNIVEIVNDSKLNIVAGEESHGLIALNAKNIISSRVGKSKITIEDNYMLYTEGDKVYLLSYLGEDKYLTIPEKVTALYQFCLQDMPFYTVTLPSGLKEIGQASFHKCSNLMTIEIPNGITNINYGVFWGCSNLTKIILPSSLTTVDTAAFLSCKRLSRIYFKGEESQFSIGVGEDNYFFTKATKYYYCETQPTTDGNFWHYDENQNAVVW